MPIRWITAGVGYCQHLDSITLNPKMNDVRKRFEHRQSSSTHAWRTGHRHGRNPFDCPIEIIEKSKFHMWRFDRIPVASVIGLQPGFWMKLNRVIHDS